MGIKTRGAGARTLARTSSGLAVAVALALAAAGCGSAGSSQDSNRSGVISAVGAENEYASVLSQIGGRYVHVSAILNNPNTDPHTFEASPQVAQEVSSAALSCKTGSATTAGWTRSSRRHRMRSAR